MGTTEVTQILSGTGDLTKRKWKFQIVIIREFCQMK